VFDPAGKVATVRTSGGLFLPGGGVETNEELVAAIHREVREECGRELEDVSYLGAAVQFFAAGGGHYEMTATFYSGRFGASVSEPEYELVWAEPSVPSRSFFHECHAWAVRELGKGCSHG
jgi:8-oxo-dGTP diphosphatase